MLLHQPVEHRPLEARAAGTSARGGPPPGRRARRAINPSADPLAFSQGPAGAGQIVPANGPDSGRQSSDSRASTASSSRPARSSGCRTASAFRRRPATRRTSPKGSRGSLEGIAEITSGTAGASRAARASEIMAGDASSEHGPAWASASAARLVPQTSATSARNRRGRSITTGEERLLDSGGVPHPLGPFERLERGLEVGVRCVLGDRHERRPEMRLRTRLRGDA